MIFDRDNHRTGGARLAALALAALMLPVLQVPMSARTSARGGPESVAPIAERLLATVVIINTSQSMKGSDGQALPKVPKGSPFEEFFDDFFNKKGGKGGGADRKASSLGSGFVIDAKEGLIVTNFHVIDGADEITVNFNDGSKLKVEKVLGRDSKTDLALLKVTPGKRTLTQASFGSSDKLRVGDWVMAMGNPFGLGHSVTVGVISAKQRELNSGPYDDYLQTDAAINKGNSGGPLFNMDGEVVGVNTAIISPSPSGGSVGVGFSVPSDVVVAVIDQLRKYGETRRGWLGVKIQTLSEDIAESLGVKDNVGALVASVTAGSPAAKAGIEDGDVILRFDGKDVSAMRSLPRLVAQTPIDKTVDVELLRKGQPRTIKVAVGRLNEDESKDKPDPVTGNAPKGGDRALIGLRLAPLGDEVRKKYGLDGKQKGVVVLEVDPASPAALKGVKAGDVIVQAGSESVTSIDDVARGIETVQKAGRQAVLLRLEDGKGDIRSVAVPLK